MFRECLGKFLLIFLFAQVAQWPQYKGHFDNVSVCRVTRRIKTKMGVAFEAQDEALVFPPDADTTPGFSRVWSFRNQIATSVPSNAVELL